jgi:hypothetical protein
MVQFLFLLLLIHALLIDILALLIISEFFLECLLNHFLMASVPIASNSTGLHEHDDTRC